jgi:predicted ATPase/class 3 adenylate cyclase
MSHPPQGTVTFLFTDIQGSTRLWEEHPEQMRPALERHDSLLREVVEEYEGYVFKTVGDAFCVAFGSAERAVSAAIAIQRSLSVESWPDGIAIAVRMGLHTGTANFRDNDYFGPAVNRTARIESAGHGGQVLLSQATADLLKDDVRPQYTLRDLGRHRLKDLAVPEQIYQLEASGLSSEFPALRTLSAQHTNLPAEIEPIVGRERAMLELEGLLARDDVRLVTLSGPGGTGKTRLSLSIGRVMLEQLRDGVFFVELETIRNPDGILPAVAKAVGVSVSVGREVIDALTDELSDKEMILILDNMEQVVSGADRVAALMQHCPLLTVLVSSRQLLNVAGEHEYPVLPLGLPERSARLSPAVASQYEAISLFRERAQQVSPTFELTDENITDVVEICRELDGMPLAIELVVSRLRLLSVRAIRERLQDTLALLTSRRRDVTARQATMRGAIDWSYELLDPTEQTVFQRLSFFEGGWSIGAAEYLLADLDFDPLEAMISLREKSLIRWTESARGEERFTMLNVIAEYGRRKLADASDRDLTHRRYVEYVAELAREVVEESFELIGVTIIDERANILHAVETAFADGLHVLALQIIQSLHQPLTADREILERMLHWSRTLTESEVLEPGHHSDAWRLYGIVQYHLDRLEDATDSFERAREIAVSAGDQDGELAAMNNLIVLRTLSDHDPEEVIALYEELIRLRKACGQTEMLGRAYANLSMEYRAVGDPEKALEMTELAMKVIPPSTPPAFWAKRLHCEALIELGRVPEAVSLFRETAAAWWDLTQNVNALPGFLAVAGMLALEVGEPRDAAICLGIIEGISQRGGMITSERRLISELESLVASRLEPEILNGAIEAGIAIDEDAVYDFLINIDLSRS